MCTHAHTQHTDKWRDKETHKLTIKANTPGVHPRHVIPKLSYLRENVVTIRANLRRYYENTKKKSGTEAHDKKGERTKLFSYVHVYYGKIHALFVNFVCKRKLLRVV